MKRLEHLRDIDEVTRKALPLPRLLQCVLEQVSRHFEVDTLSLLLVEDDYLQVAAALGPLADEVRQGVKIRVGHGFESKLLKSDEPLLLEMLDAEEITSPVLRAANLKSILGAPLIVGEHHIGVVHLGLSSDRRFTDEEVELIQRVADRVALAVAHAQAIDELQRSNERLRMLNALTADLSRRATSAEIAVTLVSHLHRAAKASASAVYLADGDSLKLTAQRGLSVDALEPLKVLNRNGRRLPLTDAFYSGQPVWLSNPMMIASAYPNLEVTTMRPEAFQACLALPMIAEGQAIGAFAVAFPEPRSFGSTERLFFESVALECAFALLRAELLEETARASQAKDEFLAILGHELRNPLAAIVAALHCMALKTDLSSPEHQIIHRQVGQLKRLADDLLDLSRIARGKLELGSEVLEVRKLVANAAEIAGPLLEKRDHHLEIEVEEGLTVRGDRSRLQQVLANLLTNAAQYTDPGGFISVTASRAGDRAVIRVNDNGIGIRAGMIPHLFEPFYQGRQQREAGQGGLGLGLAIVQNIVRVHGGEVSARSAGAGRGSEFIVQLPAIAAHEEMSQPMSTPPAISVGEGHRVLLVDDNKDAVDSLAEMLRSYGHQVWVAYDPPQAFRAVELFVPEVAVLDIELPVMDGIELGSRLRERVGKELRLFALTGYNEREDRVRTERSGFEQHFIKPVDPVLLANIISACTRA